MAKGPQLPARVDPELYSYLKFLRDQVNNLRKQVGDVNVEGDAQQALPSSGESFTDVGRTSLATGTGTATWASVDVSSYVSSNATHALIWAHLEVGSSGDQGAIDFGTDGSTVAKHAIKSAAAQSNTDTDSNSGEYRVTLTDAKTFYYQVTGTLSGTDSAWELEIVGYYYT